MVESTIITINGYLSSISSAMPRGPCIELGRVLARAVRTFCGSCEPRAPYEKGPHRRSMERWGPGTSRDGVRYGCPCPGSRLRTSVQEVRCTESIAFPTCRKPDESLSPGNAAGVNAGICREASDCRTQGVHRPPAGQVERHRRNWTAVTPTVTSPYATYRPAALSIGRGAQGWPGQRIWGWLQRRFAIVSYGL
jgi:hypothetical protein